MPAGIHVKVTVSQYSAMVGQRLATVSAVDVDAGENASLSFSIRRCTPSYVTSSLAVTSLNSTSAFVHWTETTSLATQTHYECHVTVCDRGTVTSLCAEHEVIVKIHHATAGARRPRFDKPAYHFSVPENQPADSPVGQSDDLRLFVFFVQCSRMNCTVHTFCVVRILICYVYR